MSKIVSLAKKWWPSIVHVLAAGALFLQPSVQQAAVGHPKSSTAILAVWGVVLHWLTSPKNAAIVQAAAPKP